MKNDLIIASIKDFNKEASSKNFFETMARYFVYQIINDVSTRIRPLREIKEVNLKNITFSPFAAIDLELEIEPIGLTVSHSFFSFPFEDTKYELKGAYRGAEKRVLVEARGFIQTSFKLEDLRPYVEKVLSEINGEI